MPEGPGPDGPGPVGPDPQGSGAAGDETVGSLGRELAELLRTLGAESRAADRDDVTADAAPHRCPHGWCPVCHAIELVQDHPEVASAVLDSAMAFARSVRDAFDQLLDHQRTEGGAP